MVSVRVLAMYLEVSPPWTFSVFQPDTPAVQWALGQARAYRRLAHYQTEGVRLKHWMI